MPNYFSPIAQGQVLLINFATCVKMQEIHDQHVDSAEEHAKNPNMGKHKFSNEDHEEHLASIEGHQRHGTSDEEHQNVLRRLMM